jgi:thiamine transport system ATP-binding protein
MLRVEEVTVAFAGRVVLDRVSLSVAAGEIVALLGPSGSGKSTLLRVVAGLHPPDAGHVWWDDEDITEVPTHRRHFGVVFQDEQLFPHRDVGANVAFGLRMAGRPKAEIAARVAELLELVGLAGFERRSIATLSGGEAKRVALARALAPRPHLLLLDEPLTGLDEELHDRLATDLAAVLRRAGVTAVLVTHDRDEAASIADRTVRLADLTAAADALVVEEVPAAATHDLRRRVLRNGTPSQELNYGQDDAPGTVHLAARRGPTLVGVSTWAAEGWPDRPDVPAVRLRGMAVEPGLQNSGIGAALVRAGLERAWARGADLVWASARDSALGFYLRLGFTVVGEEFTDAATGLAHHHITLAHHAGPSRGP